MTLKRSSITQSSQPKRAWIIGLASGSVAVLVVWFWAYLETGSITPQPALEDAAMLFRYAENLAAGNGISWNAGMAPGRTDGATDLGFVLALAPLVALGIDTAVAAWVLNMLSVFLLGALLGWVMRVKLQMPLLIALAIPIIIFSGPVNRYVTSGFSPPIFALYLSFLAVLTLGALDRTVLSTKFAFVIGFLASLSGWWRPEGFLMGLLIVIAAASTTAKRNQIRQFWTSKILIASLVGLAIPFLLWAAFRLVYFGHLLPSSAVMKSGGLTRVNGLESFQFYILMLLPIVAVVTCLGLARRSRIIVFFALLLIVSAMWIPVSLDLNWWSRMQWPLVPPLALIAIFSVVSRGGPTFTLKRFTINGEFFSLLNVFAAICLTLALISITRTFGLQGAPYTAYQPHAVISEALYKVNTSGIRLATSEAGLIPLAIEGQALDTFGFNNYPIASTDGVALQSELDSLKPNIVILNGPTPESLKSEFLARGCRESDLAGYLGQKWVTMGDTITAYVKKHDLQLARATATGACNIFSVYVASGINKDVLEALKTPLGNENDLL